MPGMAVMGRPFPGRPKPVDKPEQDTNIETVVEAPKTLTRRGSIRKRQTATAQVINKLLDEEKAETAAAQAAAGGGSSTPNSPNA